MKTTNQKTLFLLLSFMALIFGCSFQKDCGCDELITDPPGVYLLTAGTDSFTVYCLPLDTIIKGDGIAGKWQLLQLNRGEPLPVDYSCEKVFFEFTSNDYEYKYYGDGEDRSYDYFTKGTLKISMTHSNLFTPGDYPYEFGIYGASASNEPQYKLKAAMFNPATCIALKESVMILSVYDENSDMEKQFTFIRIG